MPKITAEDVLRVLAGRIQALRRDGANGLAERQLLENTYRRLCAYARGEPQAAWPASNREVIASILRERGASMKASQIARRAWEAGSIQSSQGLKGVYNIVMTVLVRNSPDTFVKAGGARWHLRDKVQLWTPRSSSGTHR